MRLAPTFPGQGSQSSGMGVAWREAPQWSLVEQASEAAERDVAALLLTADDDELRQTDNAQLSTYVLSLMAFDAFRTALPDAELVGTAGHSLGEYTALAAAGALDRAAGARLVAARGAAMRLAADKEPGTMAAVLGLGADEVAAAVAPVEGCWVANFNGDGNVIITGTVEGVAAGGEACKAAGARRAMPIAVGGAFHSPLMAPAADELGTALDAAPWSAPSIPVVSNVDAAAHVESEVWPTLLRTQLTSPVRWTECAQGLAGLGATALIELGPGKVLTGIAKRLLPDVVVANIAAPEDVATVLELLSTTDAR